MFWELLTIGLGLAGYFSSRYAWWRSPVSWDRPRILMYHMITHPRRGARYNGMRVSPQMFERQLAWLQSQGFAFATLSELLESRVQERTVAITLDDGYEDNYIHGLPLLQKYHAKATLYLVAIRDDTDWSAKKKPHHNSGELVRESKLRDDQVRAMLESGLVELAAHTLTHANLARLGTEEKRKEIGGSKEHLEEMFGVEVCSFAYPFGIWDETDRLIVRESGFTTAVTTSSGIDRVPFADPLAIPRVKVSGKEGFFAFWLRMRGGRRGVGK